MFKRKSITKVTFPISAMIDCTFLLLVYFMSVCSLHKQESDLFMQLPGLAANDAAAEIFDEQLIEIYGDNTVWINEMQVPVSVNENNALTILLKNFVEICKAANTKALISVAADPACSHQTVISVLDACANADISNITFTEFE